MNDLQKKIIIEYTAITSQIVKNTIDYIKDAIDFESFEDSDELCKKLLDLANKHISSKTHEFCLKETDRILDIFNKKLINKEELNERMEVIEYIEEKYVKNDFLDDL